MSAFDRIGVAVVLVQFGAAITVGLSSRGEFDPVINAALPTWFATFLIVWLVGYWWVDQAPTEDAQTKPPIDLPPKGWA